MVIFFKDVNLCNIVQDVLPCHISLCTRPYCPLTVYQYELFTICQLMSLKSTSVCTIPYLLVLIGYLG